MGTNYGDFIAEALRTLKRKGCVWIAEVRSRFAGLDGREDYDPFEGCLQSAGLTLLRRDTSNKMFVIFEAQKRPKQTATAHSIQWPALKACQYKKR